ncbi:MAG TPA: hypothetical protein VHW65_05890, partial [Gemmatimonadales bacterium]|nr:hypothetical protein [Gemmatimonadales bacterium]
RGATDPVDGIVALRYSLQLTAVQLTALALIAQDYHTRLDSLIDPVAAKATARGGKLTDNELLTMQAVLNLTMQSTRLATRDAALAVLSSSQQLKLRSLLATGAVRSTPIRE